MSTFYNNGSVIFCRLLTSEESEVILAPFRRGFGLQDRGVRLGQWHDTSGTPCSCIEFSDYCTGYWFYDVLSDLVSYCKEHSIGIHDDSFVQFYGDDDGAYSFSNQELIYLDRDSLGVHNASVHVLVDELRQRGVLKELLALFSAAELKAELASRDAG